ncbi:DUF1488 family protein [Labrys sp. KB_33_2]|uniref:DUF1488 family protein n=1 Tax=unclassified Labrys (in: a-proteobacteria) TaxID=2688601 RepID=UPI003EB7E4CB
MPLTPSDREPLDSFNPQGVKFFMMDGEREVPCLVSRAYLDDIGPGLTNNEAERIARFVDNRAFIEQIASRKHDARMLDDGYVIVTNGDFRR